MNTLLVCSFLLAFTMAMGQTVPYYTFGRCSYTGDPHLMPFPSVWNQTMNMYFCQKPGWEVLLQNKWVLVLVKVGPSPFVILDYVVIFFNPNPSITCLLIGSSGLNTCASSSAVISLTNPGGTSWNHWFPNAQFMNIQITSFPWGAGKRYDINIRQTMALIKQSTGLCVKWDCPLERILGTVTPIVIKICDVYLASARQRATGRVDDGMVNNLITACQNDLLLTFNPALARTLVGQVIHHSLDQTDGENYQNAVIKAEENIRSALLEANRLATSILGNGEICWEQKRCLETNDD